MSSSQWSWYFPIGIAASISCWKKLPSALVAAATPLSVWSTAFMVFVLSSDCRTNSGMLHRNGFAADDATRDRNHE
jgi:hypothetical protein